MVFQLERSRNVRKSGNSLSLCSLAVKTAVRALGKMTNPGWLCFTAHYCYHPTHCCEKAIQSRRLLNTDRKPFMATENLIKRGSWKSMGHPPTERLRHSCIKTITGRKSAQSLSRLQRHMQLMKMHSVPWATRGPRAPRSAHEHNI